VSRRTTSPYQVSLLENKEGNLKAEAGPVVGCLHFAAGIVVEISRTGWHLRGWVRELERKARCCACVDFCGGRNSRPCNFHLALFKLLSLNYLLKATTLSKCYSYL